MKRALAIAIAIVARLLDAQSQPQVPNPDLHYHLGPDSLAQEGVPKGEVRGPFTLPSQIFPGTSRTYWVYVPQRGSGAVDDGHVRNRQWIGGLLRQSQQG